MSLWKEWTNRLGYLGRRSRFDAELEQEAEFHIETRANELEQSGMPHAGALAQARREFGSPVRMREETRAAWHFQSLEDLLADLRYAARSFRRSPGFTITALLSLALGIGANSAIFTAMDAVLWKPLPVGDPQSLVQLRVTREKRHDLRSVPPAFADELQRSSAVFTGVTGAVGDGLSFSVDGRAERIMGEAVSHNFFALLDIRTSLGQGFSDDVRNGRWAAEAVLSYRFWKSRFAGDERVIGRTVHLNTFPFTIVGVAPASFFGLEVGTQPELWIPKMPAGRELSQMRLLSEGDEQEAARLKPGVTIAQAEAATDAQFQEFLRGLPQQARGDLGHIRLAPGETGDHGFVAQFERPLAVLLSLVALVLLIACANVAYMLLARAAARRREIAVRASMGAARARLVRQMLAENLLLWTLGGGLGLAVASWTNSLLFGLLPQGHMRMVLDLRPDLRAVLFTFAVSMATGLLFGLLPALGATRGDLTGSLKTDAAGSFREGRRLGIRKALVVSQVALSLLLLIVSGFFVRTLVNLRQADYGYRADKILLFTMKPQVELYAPQQIRNMTAELVRRVSLVPGVRSAAIAEDGPLSSRGGSSGTVGVPGGEMIRASVDEVTPGFFATIGLERLAGREFSATDNEGTPPVVILNEVLARALFKNANPIGQSVSIDLRPPKMFEVIGVVRASRYYDLRATPPPAIYFAIQQLTAYMPTLHVRMDGRRNAADVVAAVRQEFNALDKGVPVFNVKSLEDRVKDSLSRERLVAALAGAFGVLALLLAAVGLYGVMAYTVARRTREIGIRMALGSSSRSVLWLIATEAFTLTGIGMAAGTAAGLIAVRFVSNQLFGLSAGDPVTFLGACGLMMIVISVAAFIPALRASRVDPLLALRCD